MVSGQSHSPNNNFGSSSVPTLGQEDMSLVNPPLLPLVEANEAPEVTHDIMGPTGNPDDAKETIPPSCTCCSIGHWK